jgi:heterodisulfide reductase subunit C
MDLTPTQVIHAVRLGLRDLVLDSKTIWLCASCETCTTRCPQEVDIAKVMDAARILARREGRRPKIPEVAAFHKSVLESLRMFGRLYELGAIGALKLRTMKLTEDLELGLRMFKKGKFRFIPAFANVLATNRIFRRVKKAERART